jgi:hypothetical protein
METGGELGLLCTLGGWTAAQADSNSTAGFNNQNISSVYGVYPAWLNLQGRQWTAAGSDYQPTAHHVEGKGAQLHRVKKRKGGKVKKLV